MLDGITQLNNIPVLLLPQAPKGAVKCLIAAPLPVDLTGGAKSYEYWLCDIILIPKKKYGNPKTMYGWKYADVLSNPRWPNPNEWEEIKET